jgi:S1-C subfamily serine protease
MYAQKRSPNLLVIVAIALAALLILAVVGVVLVGVLVFGVARTASPAVEQVVETQSALIAEDPTVQGEASIVIPPTPPVDTTDQRQPETNGTVLGQEGTLVELYRRLVPGVVSVQVLQRDATGQLAGAAGSGFFYDSQGHIVTNAHVIESAEMVEVVLSDETIVPAEVVGMDDDSDLAVLKVDLPVSAFTVLSLADSDAVLPGQEVIAIGNPFGQQSSMTYGIISAVGRTIVGLTPFSIPQAIQTDAAINPGNSGGPLLSLDGEVIGVNAQIESAVRANAGVGFAIPSNIVARVVPTLIAEGRFHWPWLGVEGGSVTPRLAEANGLPTNTRGAYISGIVAGGPAEAAGLRGITGQTEIDGLSVPTGGDIVVAMDGKPVRDMDDLILDISRQEIGDRVTLTVLRDGSEIELTAHLVARPD